MHEKKIKEKKSLIGLVTSTQRNKTITVLWSRKYQHPSLKKTILTATKCHVHDENNLAQVGQRVCIEFSRPLSKTKHWNLKYILEDKAS